MPVRRERKKGGSKTKKSSKAKFSIKLKLLGSLIPVAVIVISMIIGLIYFNTSDILLKKSETLLSTNTDNVVNKVNAWLNKIISTLDAKRDTIEFFSADADLELEYIKHTAGKYDAFPAGIYLGLTDGTLIHPSFIPEDGYTISDRPWYIDGLNSQDFVIGPTYFDADSQKNVVSASGLLKNKNGTVRGVLSTDIYLDAICKIVEEVQIEKTGGMFLVDGKTNTIIGHKDSSIVGSTLEEQQDGMYQYTAEHLKNNTIGLSTYQDPDEGDIYLDFEQVPGSGWVTVSYVPGSEVMADLNILTRNIILVAAVGIFLLLIFLERLIHVIVKPVRKITETITEMTDGDFSIDVEVRTRDEIGTMASSLKEFIKAMKKMMERINNISHTLNIKSDSSREVAGKLSDLSDIQAESMSQFNTTVDEMAHSISEVAESATTLSMHVQDAALRGQEAKTLMGEAVDSSEEGKKNMEQVIHSMSDISDKMLRLEQSVKQVGSSIKEINSIVALIRNIAEETNLLSLNASIEAARAGEAGRGFAVVAEQIGSLASTSTEAVDNIAGLTGGIEKLVLQTVEEASDNLSAIHTSADIVTQAGKSFGMIFESIHTAHSSVAEIIDKVNQVSDIATNVAGITEEQSAASEEMLATSESLGENAFAVRESSKTIADDSKQLALAAKELREHMSKFTI